MASIVLEHLKTFGPQQCERLTYDQATAYTRDLAEHHYENFTVVSRLLPALARRLRPCVRLLPMGRRPWR